MVVTHPKRGQLMVTLTSPNTTQDGILATSVLAIPRINDSGKDLIFKFTTPFHWGESSEGHWEVTVSDLVAGDKGVFENMRIIFYGTPL